MHEPVQREWLKRLFNKAGQGCSLFSDAGDKAEIHEEFRNRIRTEEIKAWYSCQEGDSLFQGTSISSLTIPGVFTEPVRFDNIGQLQEVIAQSYIENHWRTAPHVKAAIMEDVGKWLDSGLFYCVVVASKVISQAFSLKVRYEDVVLKVDDFLVDPHEITSYPYDVRVKYFDTVKERIECFGDLDISRQELESSLILADISKPKIERFKDNIILAPVRCNDIAAAMAKNIKKLITEKTQSRIKPASIAVVIYDTDTPYTYYHITGADADGMSPQMPGLTVLGSSGTIDALRWLYIYRVSLIAQKMMKSSLYSEVHRRFIPFVFFGVLVPRDADILLDMQALDLLRYHGNITPNIEFAYLLPDIIRGRTQREEMDFRKELEQRTHSCASAQKGNA
ncbi:MAG: hypothetical protein HQK88_12765 [Nitrospirae bacterium]|nr:hypothetical protein [Nitrospirota bacterium]MBF0535786.1 hypothetical protein [Nitrospirota bacterium]MBF0617673.1 hypothetical protein [Nitrospirota bacterium]